MEKIRIGKAVLPMLVHESYGEDRFFEILKNHGRTLAETKSDGNRIQVHKGRKILLFTRNLNKLSIDLFPEIREELENLPYGIYDGEIVGIDDGVHGFNAVLQRKRKEYFCEIGELYPVTLKLFDVLKISGREVISQPLRERRKILEDLTDNLSLQCPVDNKKDLEVLFNGVVNSGYEGLVCKNPDSLYLPGKRTREWIKLKKSLSLDLVVLGVYKGLGKADELPFAALLLGVNNNGTYETITKVGVSSPLLVKEIDDRLLKFYRETVPEKVRISGEINKKVYQRKIPAKYIDPLNSVVVEVEALDVTRSCNWHSCGLDDNKAYSLRIPVVKCLRSDKDYTNCAKLEQVEKIYFRNA